MLTSSLFESILNNSPSAYYLLSPSPDPYILAVNDTFLKKVSRQRDELIGKKLFDAFPGDPEHSDNGTQVLRNSLLKVIESGQPDCLPMQCYPIKVINKNGIEEYEERFWNAVNTPLFDTDGQLIYISHHTTDVTEKVQADKALLHCKSRFLSLTESIDEGYCVLEMLFNEQGEPIDYIFDEVNPMFEIQTGLQNATGKSMRELAPQHEAHWFEIYGKVSKTGIPIRFENEAKALNRWYDVYAYKVDESDKNMVGVLFRDITLRKKHEAALLESDNRLRALINATAEVVYRMSPDWTQIRQLEGRGYLKDIEDSNELWIDEYIPIEHQDLVHKAIKVAIRDKTHFQLEHIVRRADGSLGWMDSRAVPMLNTSGEIMEWVGAARDITERKLAEEELHKTGRRKDDFLAMLAHELRNPLAPISAAADLLGMIHLNDPKVKQTSEIITRQVKHMTGLVDDLLDVSRVTKGLVKLDKTKQDIKTIIADSVEQVRPLIEARKHQLTVHTPPESAFVMGDQKRLVQVLSNLLNNAAKYTPEGGSIVLSMEIDGEYVKTTISDNGIGLEPEMVKQVFELFTQAARTSDRSQGGLGIGLALAKSLVELHDGSISVSSGGIGKGSEFLLSLPNHIEQANEPVVEDTTAIKTPAIHALKIMIVDDNVDAAEMLAILLETSGHDVIVENNPLKALERVKREKPDVCLLDIGLPEIDGKELARRLRAQSETSKTTLIAITGYGIEQERDNALKAGFDHYFVKPIDILKLLSVLGNESI